MQRQDLAPTLPTLTKLFRALGLLCLAGWSWGISAGFILLMGSLDRLVTNNQIGNPARRFLLVVTFSGSALLLISGCSYLLMSRMPGGVDRLYGAAKRLSPLCLVGFVPFLFQWSMWQGLELTFLFAVAVFSLAASTATRVALSSPPLLQGSWSTRFRQRVAAVGRPVHDCLEGRRWRWLPGAIVVLGSIGYGALFSYSTVSFHRAFRTASYDLGLEDNLVWNVLHGIGFFRSTPFGGPESSHFGHHATFFAYVIAPLYALRPRADTLLVIQAVMIGAAAVPLFLFARRHLAPWTACLVALCYLLYPPVHGANLYEFHYLPLGAVFLWSALVSLEARRDRWAVLAIVLALSVREDVGAGLAVIGAYLLMTGVRPQAGLVVAVVGTLHFVLLKLVFMPLAMGHQSFVYMYKDLLPAGDETFGGMLKTVAGNPLYTLGTLLQREKLLFLLQLFVPLAFIPLRRPIIFLLLVPGFFFTLLSTGYAPLIQISFQYTFHWTVFLFMGMVAALARTRKDRVRSGSLIVALVCGILPTSYQMGAVFQRNTVRGGFSQYNFKTSERDRKDRSTFMGLISVIPPRAKVAASDNLVPHISNRPAAYTLRFSVYDAEYLLFFTDPQRIDGSEKVKVTEALTSGDFGVVDVREPFAVARRGHTTAMNQRVLAPWATP